jgi:hypothetical protein
MYVLRKVTKCEPGAAVSIRVAVLVSHHVFGFIKLWFGPYVICGSNYGSK